MAIRFAKMAPGIDSHPKIRRAGRAGREVFLFILRRNADLDRSGRVPLTYVEPWYLADQLMMPEAEAIDGLAKCIAAGLLKRHHDNLSILGWDDEWAKAPLDEAERKRRQREKDEASAPKSKRQRKRSRNVTNPIVTQSDCPDSHASEESREEEKRVEENRAEGAGPPAPGLFVLMDAVDVATGDLGKARAKPVRDRVEARAQTDHQRAIENFDQRFTADNAGHRYDWKEGGSTKKISELVKAHGASEVIRRTDLLFDRQGPAWLSPPFTVGTLKSQWNALVKSAPSTSRNQPTALEQQLERVRMLEAAEAEQKAPA